MPTQILDGNGSLYLLSIVSGTNPAAVVTGSLTVIGSVSAIAADEGTPVNVAGSAWVGAGSVGSIAFVTVPAATTYRIRGFTGTAKTYAFFTLQTNNIDRAWGRATPSQATCEVNHVSINDATANTTILLTAKPDFELDIGSKLIYGNIKIFSV